MLPGPPTNYAGTVAGSVATLTWENGADAISVIHEVSEDGTNFQRLDEDFVPAVEADHGLPEQDKLFYLRAKSKNADGESDYTAVVELMSGHYDP